MTVINFPEVGGSSSDMRSIRRFSGYVSPEYGTVQILRRPVNDPAFARANAIKIETLPTRTIEDATKEITDQCAICFEPWKEQDVVKTLPCLHYYHTACINQWLGTKLTCPTCRTKV